MMTNDAIPLSQIRRQTKNKNTSTKTLTNKLTDHHYRYEDINLK
jgi:hypothetical protein